MRRPLILAAIAGAALSLGWPVVPAPGARAAQAAGCGTEATPIAFAAPSGALYLVKTAFGRSRIAGPGLSGTLPAGCALGELGYNPTDGFLYAMRENASHETGDGPELVRIGRASAAGGLAASTVGALGGIGEQAVADMDGSGRYTTLSVDPGSQRAMIRRFTAGGRSTGRATAIRWDASCAPALGNLAAEYRLHARQARTPAPPHFVDDWAFDPADGRFYAYSAVDALDPYLGQADPSSKWTVRPLPDQVVAVDPARGTAACAPVRSGAPVRSSLTSLAAQRATVLGGKRGDRGEGRRRENGDRRSRRPDDRESAADRGPLGGSAITGAAFTGPHQLTLVEGGRAELWRLDVSRCFSGGCRPVRRGRSAAALGDAAGHPYSPAQLTIRAVTSTDSPSVLALTSEQTGLVTLGGGQSRTADLVPGSVTIRRAGDGSLSGIDCNGGDPAVHGGPAPDAVRLTIRQQEHVVCTFQSGRGGQAAGAPAGGAAALPGGSPARARRSAAKALAGPHSRGPFSAFTEGSTAGRVLATAIAFALACALGGLLYVTLPRLLRVRVKPGRR
ncbi:MAG: hypothetical protein JWO79_651 [Actinomycetia bacterium]|nr:hypothetical protein [Actinomycetes bacterium]